MDTDVLVVGAGPTGLMLANQLARLGVRVLIVDRSPGPAKETRALGVQARTLEIYAKLGVVDRALDLGKIGTGADLWAQGRRTARIPLGDAGKWVSPYPFILILGQDDNELILGDKLRDFGISVQWQTELVDLRQEPDAVTATLQSADGTRREISAAWVGGCDGAHSTVRALNGIDFPGAPYEHIFFLADTEATGSMVPDEVNVYLWRAGFHLLFPLRGQNHWRIVGILPPNLRRDDVTFQDVLPSVRHEAGAGLAIHDCMWFSTYRIHHRRASKFRNGRCFLLGDAAHVHSPVGAQGMNTGLQDAYNLAWKLALLVRGQAEPALLDTYADERIPVAERLLRTTDRAFTLIVSDGWFAGLLRSKILARIVAFAMSFERVQNYAFRVVSQTAIRYRNSRLSQTDPGLPDDGPQAGDRFPWLQLRLEPGGPEQDLFGELDDTRFNLVLIGQPAPPAATDILGQPCRVHAVPADAFNHAELTRAKIPAPSFYLLRPDGHIGLCGTHLDVGRLQRYAAECLGLAAA